MKIKHRILTFALAGGFALFGLFSAASVPAAAAEITTAEQAELNAETDNYQEGVSNSNFPLGPTLEKR